MTQRSRVRSRVVGGCLVAVVVPIAASCGGGDPEPFAFTSPENEYTVTFPDGEPDNQAVEEPQPDGTTLSVDLYQVTHDSMLFAVARTPLPSAPDDPTITLEATRDGAISAVSGTLIESNPIELGGRPGVEYSADVVSEGEEGMVLSRIYLTGSTLFQVMVVGEGELVFTDTAIAGFFDSFQFAVPV